MHLPWDRNYFKLSFYLIISLSVFYIIKTIIDTYAFMLSDVLIIAEGIAALIADALTILMPLILSLVVSYLLSPLVALVQRKTKVKSRVIAVSITYVMIVIIFALPIVLMGFGGAHRNIEQRTEAFTSQLNDMLILIRLNLIEWDMDRVIIYMDRFLERMRLQGSDGEIIRGVTLAARFFIDLFVGAVCAFYLLINKDKLLASASKTSQYFIKESIYKRMLMVFSDIHRVLAGYIRGQALDALIISVLIGGGLKLLGVEFALVIGVITGFSNLIPFVGALVGFVLSVVMAAITGPPILVLYVALYVLFIQQLDSMVIIPKIVGTKVDLSPPAVILSVVIGGRLFGLFGMVFAVPASALVKIWLARFLETLAIQRTDKYNIT